MTKFLVAAFLLGLTCIASPASAGVSQKSLIGIEASKAAVAGDYRRAIALYGRLIQIDPNNANNYVQRGLMYRQVKNKTQSQRDATMAHQLASLKLQQNNTGKRGAKYYWQRAMAYRLLEDFNNAKLDMKRAMQLKGDQRWLPDLQAIELESRIHSSGRR